MALFCSLPLQANGSLPNTPSPILIKLSKKRDGNLIRFFVENSERVGVTATFELGLVNMQGNTHFPCTLTFPPGKTTEAFTLTPLDAGSFWTYSLTNYYTLGSNLAVHDDSCLYKLPYSEGRTFTVTQGFNGEFSHSGAEKYAIDWSMPEGTAVLAARGGVVVGTRDDSTRGGPSRNFENDANYILIQHSDGTIGNYAHLSPRGVTVKIGQVVNAGELIGYSGNTGFTSGAHLHFSVFRAKDGRNRESIPIRFNVNGRALTLLRGESYSYGNTPLLATQGSRRGAHD